MEKLEDIYHKIMEETIIPKQINPDSFKVHCSKIGSIMQKQGLGKTGETELQKWYLSKKYGRKPDWYSKFVEKGLMVEDVGINCLSKHLDIQLHKNDEWFEGDFMIGTPDIIHDGIVYDIKSSWDIFTFPFFGDKIPNNDYEYQMQGYLSLTGYKSAVLVYCLIDTPQVLITQELRRLYYDSGGRAEDWTPETNIELAENYKFNDIPLSDKMRFFRVERDDVKIKAIQDRVVVCREFLRNGIKK